MGDDAGSMAGVTITPLGTGLAVLAAPAKLLAQTSGNTHGGQVFRGDDVFGLIKVYHLIHPVLRIPAGQRNDLRKLPQKGKGHPGILHEPRRRRASWPAPPALFPGQGWSRSAAASSTKLKGELDGAEQAGLHQLDGHFQAMRGHFEVPDQTLLLGLYHRLLQRPIGANNRLKIRLLGDHVKLIRFLGNRCAGGAD